MPILLIIISAYLVAVPMCSNPAKEYLFVVGFVIVGVLVYVPFILLKWNLPLVKEVTKITMKALNLSDGAKEK